MAIQEHRRHTGATIPAPRVGHETPAQPGTLISPIAARILAVLRLSIGFVFLWAFLDKTFGWGYATTSKAAWIHGGSPTKGFLSNVEVGPFRTMFHAWAGTPWANWLFMLGLLGVGLALVLGVALRPAALAGTLMLALMWAAEWPLARHTFTGAPSMSTNPLIDYHVIYALALIVVAATFAGNTWGLGRTWSRLRMVRGRRWLL